MSKMYKNQLTFGRKLRELRTEKGLTQEQLGEKIDVSANAIGQFERWKILPNYTTIANIINTLDIDANLIFSRESVEYPDEAVWIAKLLINLNQEEKRGVCHFLEGVTRIILGFDKDGGNN